MWIERKPKENDVVKITFADWCGRESLIGICKNTATGYYKIDIGNRIIFLDWYSEFLVWVNN